MGTFIQVEKMGKHCSQGAKAEWGGSWRRPKKPHKKCEPYVIYKGVLVL